MSDTNNCERFCDDFQTIVKRNVSNLNMVSLYLFDVDMSELVAMMNNPKFT